MNKERSQVKNESCHARRPYAVKVSRCWWLSATQKWSSQYGIATDTPIPLSTLLNKFQILPS